MEFIIDVKGFELPVNEFIVKELAILPIECKTLTKPINFHFLPPCQWTCVSLKYKNINRWLENNFHSASFENPIFGTCRAG